MRLRTTLLCLLALVAPAVVLLGGCGAASGPSGGARPVADTSAARHVRVGLTEWQVDVAPTRALPGRITLVVTNAGATEHNLVVQAGSRRWSVASLSPSKRARLVVRAPAGARLQLSSQVPGQLHPMRAVLPVSR